MGDEHSLNFLKYIVIQILNWNAEDRSVGPPRCQGTLVEELVFCWGLLIVVPDWKDANLGNDPPEDAVLRADGYDTDVSVVALKNFRDSTQSPLLGWQVILFHEDHGSNMQIVAFPSPLRPVMEI